MVHFLNQSGFRKSCECGSHVVKSYLCEADGEVYDIVFRCGATGKVIDLP